MPEYITYEELKELIQQQTEQLPGPESAWWQAHRVEPFPARSADLWHFVIARRAQQIILFADDEDEFCIGSLEQDQLIGDCVLIGDLIDAVRWFLRSA